MEFDLEQVPLSRYGSYLTCSVREADGDRRLFLRTVRGDVTTDRVFRVDLLDDGPVEYDLTATPGGVTASAPAGSAEFTFTAPDLLRVEGDLPVRLTLALPEDVPEWMKTHVTAPSEGSWRINSFAHGSEYLLTGRDGALTVDAPWNGRDTEYVEATLRPGEEPFVCTVEDVRDEPRWTTGTPATAGIDAPGEAFERWLEGVPAVPAEFESGRRLAGYVLWASTVEPVGHLDRPGTYMTKNWMNSVWSWDHCFNAMALADGHPELAWDQFVLPFDHQAESGVLPDAVNDTEIVWNYTKPPIHGWTLRLLRERSDAVGRAELAEIYEPLQAWTEWWFDHRDDDGDGIPEYHHGNDSGWDNGTAFFVDPPVEAPDLSTYLVLQLEELSTIADRLDKPAAADRYAERADALVDRLVEHSWTGERFEVPQAGTHETDPRGDSLLPFVPLVLGDRLPADVHATLLDGLTEDGRFLGAYGPASEALDSDYYAEDSYWRGSVWPPSTMLIVEALAAAGETDLAADVSRRYCRAVADHEFPENHDPVTGEGYRDTGFTWTASVFLVLAHEYL